MRRILSASILVFSSGCYAAETGSQSVSLTLNDILTIAALVIGPTIGVFVTIVYQRLQDKKKQKLWVMATLVSNRHMILSADNIKALNSIDYIFAKNQNIRSEWAKFVEVMRNAAATDQDRIKQYNSLIDKICESLGYGSAMRYLDIDRVIYDPSASTVKTIENGIVELINWGKEYIKKEVNGANEIKSVVPDTSEETK